MVSFSHWDADCESLFVESVFAEIADSGYDVAILDAVMYSCIYTIPYKLNIPYISLSVPYGMWGYR